MISFLAIVKLTCRSALRSHIFRLLLICLLVGIFVLPSTLISDGTLKGEIQLILQYSLGFVFTILTISSVWLACSEICSDVENGVIHPVIVKPVPRWRVLFAKFSGVVLIHLVLLLISAVVIYGYVLVKSSSTGLFGSNKFLTEKQLAEIEMTKQQIFTARKKYRSVVPDFKQAAQEEFMKRKEEAKRMNQDVTNYDISTTSSEMLAKIEEELKQQSMVVKPNEAILWRFENLEQVVDKPLYLQYTVYPIAGLTSEQELTRGRWFFRVVYVRQDEATGEADIVQDVYPCDPEDILTVMNHEMMVPVRPEYLIYEGTVEFGFVNLGENELMFDRVKGPFLLVPETSFLANYLSGIVIMALGIVSLTLIASACSACFSLPIAIFFSVTYLLAGIVSDYLVSTIMAIPGYKMDAMETYGVFTSNIFLVLLVPIQDFFITEQLSNGELLGWSAMFRTFFFDIVLRSMPFYLLGTLLYTRREIAIVMKH